MSDLMTRIIPANGTSGDGFMDWGEKDAAEMIQIIRAYADQLRERVARIDQTADHQFAIHVVRGRHVQRPVRTIQEQSA